MKTKRIALGLLVVACLLPFVAASDAQKAQKQQNPCEDAATQAEMNQCARKEHEAADAELNKVYNRFAAMLDDEQRAQLKGAELAWIKYRDATCEFEGS
ncbi:MAG TPA: lysozyme inhibitor LprI family protein, partial [Pyrinomonadaceae bacterium]|nr:lysozyme inhibitor LprI family protein [Pyrinomonadaceae bacterium]